MIAGASNTSPPLRTAILPLDHLDAELLAVPFAFDSAFKGALVSLNPTLEHGAGSLWRESERELLCRFPGLSIDELMNRRDRAWFVEPGFINQAIPLGEVLRQAAMRVVSVGSGISRPLVKPDSPEAVQRRYWRWLTFSLPADLLLAAAGASSERPQMVSNRLLSQLAEGGVAEPHLHLKAAMDFPILWASLMRELAHPRAKAHMLQSPGAEWDEGRGLAPLLLRCALARLLLAAFLREPGSIRSAGFHLFLESQAGPRLNRRFGAYTCAPLWRAVYSLAAGQTRQRESFELLRGLYAQLIGSKRSGDDIDPIADWFAPHPVARPDFGFTRTALDYLREDGAGDLLFARVFWQVQRSRVLFYRHIVQRPMVPGLQWFTRTYGRLSNPRKQIGVEEFVRLAANLAGPGLRSLEVRVTPESTLTELRDVITQVNKGAKSLPKQAGASGQPEVGLVFHFSRTRGKSTEAGRPAAWSRDSYDDPAAWTLNPSGYRYAGYYCKEREGAMTLANLLTVYPQMVWRVRGIDLCTDELAVPLWVLLPLVQYIQRAADEAATFLLLREGQAPKPLAVTVHAGEDYVHLLGGIRRVAEAVEWLNLGEGSRIGHAVALGVDARAWAARVRRMNLPVGERLLDLLWAWGVVRNAPAALRSWLPWLDQELIRLGMRLFDKPLVVEQLYEWRKLLHTPWRLRAVGFPSGPGPRGFGNGANETLDLLYQWLSNREVFRRAQEFESVDVERETALVVDLQAHVRGMIGSRGIIVEINPSSNLLIGQLGDLTSHPLWRLCPPAGLEGDAPGVRVCIGSDDPITFATSLPEEYQLLADALTDAGVAGPDVDAWLEAARQCGMTNRFTLPRSRAGLTALMSSNMPPPPL